MDKLIAKLTWAIVENDLEHPDRKAIADVLNDALADALLRHEAQRRVEASLLRTAQAMGQP